MSRLLGWTLNLLYLVVLAVASPLLVWSAATKGKYREGFAAKLLGSAPLRQGNRPCIWLHAVSVGEVNLLATTLAEIARRRDDLDVVISTTTRTGYELAQRKYGPRHTVFYCPLDFTWATKRAMRRVRPDVLVLAELELWPNLIAAAKRYGGRVAIVNGRLSDNSYRGYRRLGKLVSHVLGQVDLIAAQDAATAQRFGDLRGRADDTIAVTGSLKYDGAQTNRQNPRSVELRRLAGYTADHTVLLAGSTQSPEEEIAVRVYRRLVAQHPELRLILVPRHPERFDEVARMLEGSGTEWQRRSQLTDPLASPPGVLLVDTVGELGAWWASATIGFVGGSFGDRGGQNMIEPAAYGVATCFGPNTRNFRDIVAALLAADAAQVVQDEAALAEFVGRCLGDRAFAQQLGERAKSFVTTQLGATARTVDLLETLLPAGRLKREAA